MSFRFRFSKNELLKLFLVCVAPVHFWTLVVILLNIALINKRDLWYFGGYSGYLLGMALLDSVLLFAFVIGLSFLFPKKWTENIPLTIAGAIALVIAFWAIINQLYFFLSLDSSGWFSWVLLRVRVRQRLTYPALVAVVAASAAVPLAVLPQYQKARTIFLTVLENIGLLSYMYLLFDGIGFAVVALRNLY